MCTGSGFHIEFFFVFTLEQIAAYNTETFTWYVVESVGPLTGSWNILRRASRFREISSDEEVAPSLFPPNAYKARAPTTVRRIIAYDALLVRPIELFMRSTKRARRQSVTESKREIIARLTYKSYFQLFFPSCTNVNVRDSFLHGRNLKRLTHS